MAETSAIATSKIDRLTAIGWMTCHDHCRNILEMLEERGTTGAEDSSFLLWFLLFNLLSSFDMDRTLY